MTYREAMDRFGSDKPDLRFGIELTELTSYFADTPFRVFQAPYVGAVVMPGGGSQPRRAFDAWQDWAKSRGAKGLAYVTIAEDGTLGGPVAKNISDAERDGLVAAVGAQPGRLRLLRRRRAPLVAGAAGRGPQRDRQAAGAHRAGHLVVPVRRRLPDVRGDRGRRLDVHAPPVHLAHAGVAGHASPTNKGEALSDAYDMVINGNEVMSGSVRIHDAGAAGAGVRDPRHVARGGARAVRLLPRGVRLRPAAARGCRARLGPDVLALLSGVESIREVIAFPKTGAGFDPLTGAPTPITEAQRTEAGIDAKPEEPALPGEPGHRGRPDPARLSSVGDLRRPDHRKRSKTTSSSSDHASPRACCVRVK